MLVDKTHETSIQVLATSTRRNAEIRGNVDDDPSNGVQSEATLNFGDDDENMVSSSKGMPVHGHTFDAYTVSSNRDKHLRYRTRLFAADYVNLLFSTKLLKFLLCNLVRNWPLLLKSFLH